MIVKGTNLTMIRGDSEKISVSCTKDGILEPLVSGDKIYFTVKNTVYETNKIFQKIITNFVDGKANIEIEPLDTKNLKFIIYKYDVQLTRADGTVITIIPASDFTINPEVTYE